MAGVLSGFTKWPYLFVDLMQDIVLKVLKMTENKVNQAIDDLLSLVDEDRDQENVRQARQFLFRHQNGL